MSALLFLLVAVCEASSQCQSWCNSYTCSIGSPCTGCSVCHELIKGEICAGWCNPYTTMFQHCKGCTPKVELHEWILTNGTGYCQQRCNPMMQGSYNYTNLGSSYVGNYTYSAQFDLPHGTDPAKVYEQCVEAVGHLYKPTISCVSVDSGDFDPFCFCNSKCEFQALSYTGSEYKVYSKPEDVIKDAAVELPLVCNSKPWHAAYCTPEVYYEGYSCSKRPGSDAGTVFEDCLEVWEYTPTSGGALPNGCSSENLTAGYKAAVVAAAAGKPLITDDYNRRNVVSMDPSSLPVGVNKVTYQCSTDPAYPQATFKQIWFSAPDGSLGNCDGPPDLTYYYDGGMAYNYYEAAQCKELNVLNAEGLQMLNSAYPDVVSYRGRALQAGGRARRGLQSTHKLASEISRNSPRDLD